MKLTQDVIVDPAGEARDGEAVLLGDKHRRMRQAIAAMGRVIVAFSAGVDSTVVLRVALDVLGPDNVLAATGASPSLSMRELQSVKDLATLMGAPLEIVNTSEMDQPGYSANGSDRCYFCKGELYGKLTALARERGYRAVLNGVNLDDTGDHRPGLQAAKEFEVHAPLMEAGMSKADVRQLAKTLGLPNWEKPALACLSSRIPYGTPVTIASLRQIELAEEFLYKQGFKQFRVRHHQKLARIEVPVAELRRLIEEPLRSEMIAHFKELGYIYVTIDLAGFRSGSGNEVLTGRNGAET